MFDFADTFAQCLHATLGNIYHLKNDFIDFIAKKHLFLWHFVNCRCTIYLVNLALRYLTLL